MSFLLLFAQKNNSALCSWYHVVNVLLLLPICSTEDGQKHKTDKQVQKVCSLGLPNRTMDFMDAPHAFPNGFHYCTMKNESCIITV